MGTRWARFVRGWVIAVFSTLVAALSHSLAVGTGPSLLAIVLSLAFAGMACVGLAGKRLSLWRMSASVAFSQMIFHGIFSSMSGPFPASVVLGHVHNAALASVPVLSSTHASHAAWHSTPLMAIAHLGAGVATLAILRYGERAYWGLLDTTRVLIRVLFPAAPVVTVGATPRVSVTARTTFTLTDLGVPLLAMRYRGPPAALSLT
ncbi:MAG: hypothetical protein ABI275_06570 [Terrimesophilobacter sp.]